MNEIRNLLKENREEDALCAIYDLARRTTDYSAYASLCRARRRIKAVSPGTRSTAKDLRIVIFGGATTGFFEEPLKLELETIGIHSQLFSGLYNTYVADMLNPDSEAAAFGPDVALFMTTPFDISDWPRTGDSEAAVEALAERMLSHWLGLCDSFHAATGSEIIMNNLHMWPERIHGNLGCRLPWDRNSFLKRINQKLAASVPPYVHILDVDTLSSIHGVSRWFDIRFWHHSKQPVAFECVIPFIRNLSAMIGGLYGRSCKCVVVDLDNTLWGGVVGDDGVEGIKIGAGDPLGESFKAFQEYLIALKNRGVLLAVCSKNDESNALEPFRKLPEMALKWDDFVAFNANWESKPDNLRAIAKELNLGLDALLFVDDNPAERAHVRQVLPEVKVLEMPEDPALFPRHLDQCGWLEQVSLTAEDLEKTEQYRKNRLRKELESGLSDYESYLESLEQCAEIRRFEPQHLDRITQLINKTNQFNLTTLRLSRSEVEAMMEDPSRFSVSVRLVDRFGDNGLISVLSGQIKQNVLCLDLWLMSCRVFKRGVERLLANHLFEQARTLGIDTVQGIYIATPKNGLVSQHYANLGFTKLSEHEGMSTWEIGVADYHSAPVRISLI